MHHSRYISGRDRYNGKTVRSQTFVFQVGINFLRELLEIDQHFKCKNYVKVHSPLSIFRYNQHSNNGLDVRVQNLDHALLRKTAATFNHRHFEIYNECQLFKMYPEIMRVRAFIRV